MDFIPKNCKVYPLSPEKEKKLNKFIDKNLWKGYIRFLKLPMASSFFFVRKKDGSMQLCQDYRYLNEEMIKNTYSLLLISNLVDKIKEWKRFTKMNLWSEYNNIRIKNGDQWKAAFKTARGLYKPTVIFFGLCNSLTTFQVMINDLFKDMLREGWLQIYMDDIFICSNDLEDLQCKTIRVVKQLQDNNLYFKPKKCIFDISEVKFLEMIIKYNQVSMDPIKVKRVLDWPVSMTVK